MLKYTYILLAQMKDVIVYGGGERERERNMYQNKYICGTFLEDRY